MHGPKAHSWQEQCLEGGQTILGTHTSFWGKEGEEGFVCHSFLAMDVPLGGCRGALGGNPFFSCSYTEPCCA